MTIQQIFHSASEHHRAGRLAQAEHLYRVILAEQPNHADALNLLGVLANQTGHPQDACEWINKAIHQQPVAEYYFNLAGALLGLSRMQEAIEALRRAIAIKPNLSAAHANLGTLLQDGGKLDEAIACFQKAIALSPTNSLFHYNLGNAYSRADKKSQAVEAFTNAIRLDPRNAQAINNLGSVLHALDQYEEAARKFRQALAIKPDFTAALNNLGNVLLVLGQYEQAVNAISEALRLDPKMAVACNNLGNALSALGRFDEAIEIYRRGIALQPQWPEIHNNLSIALRFVGNIDGAIAAAETALSQRPDFMMARENLAQALQLKGEMDQAMAILEQIVSEGQDDHRIFNSFGNALRSVGRLEEALASYRRAAALDEGNFLALSNYLFALQFHSDDAELILAEHRAWDRRYAEPLRKEIRPFANDRRRDRRLRVGYFSPDFRNHCQALFTSALFSHHDHEQFEIYCYAATLKTDAVTAQITRHADQWRNVATSSDNSASELIRADGIDVLVDLTMHMGHCRPLVFARKPAPVQVCWLAYPGTTGMSTMDYRLSDPYLDPAGFEGRYSEKTLRLPDTFWCYDPRGTLAAEPGVLPDVNELPARKNGFVTFGCLNDFSKVNAGTVQRWGRLMQAVGGSRLHLLAPRGKCREVILEALGSCGVNPDRVEFIERQPRPAYLAEYLRIDLCLDTLPYNGHTTSLDAFWMGVPVLTQMGRTVVGRAGLSQLTNLQLPDFAAETDEQFIALGRRWAEDISGLSEIRRALRERMVASPLMDGKKFARGMEAAFGQMWQNHLAQ